MRLYIKPGLGNRTTATVGRCELDELHQSLKDRHYQANRVLALLSKMFPLAVAWGWRADNLAKGIKWRGDARHVSVAMKLQVFNEYGLTGNHDPLCLPKGRKIDHLIGRECGGADDVRHFWPQP
jgi:hypothetical protein